MKLVRFTRHAEKKLEMLKTQGFPISREFIIETIRKPDRIEIGRRSRYEYLKL